MNREHVSECVLKAFRDQVVLVGGDPDRVVEDLRFDDLFGVSANLDSLDMVEIAMGLEEDFGVEIDDDAMWAWETLGATVDYIFDLVRGGR